MSLCGLSLYTQVSVDMPTAAGDVRACVSLYGRFFSLVPSSRHFSRSSDVYVHSSVSIWRLMGRFGVFYPLLSALSFFTNLIETLLSVQTPLSKGLSSPSLNGFFSSVHPSFILFLLCTDSATIEERLNARRSGGENTRKSDRRRSD